MPAHIAGAVLPAVPCATKVSQRKAPGAMSAMAFMVKPVKPKVGFISGAVVSAMYSLLLIDGRPARGPMADNRGPVLHSMIGVGREEKRKFLIAEISVLYRVRRMTALSALGSM